MSKKKEEDDLEKAHKYSINNKRALLKDELCGCFFCLKIFSPTEITDWIDKDQTALCPRCSIDSIIGESSGFPITEEFLEKMRDRWFSVLTR